MHVPCERESWQSARTVNGGRRNFLGQLGTAALIAGFGDAFPTRAFAKTDAESPGISAAAVLAFLDAAAASAHEVHSLVVARNGRVAARGWFAPYRAEAPHSLYSLSKGFTSTAVGFALTAGKLRLTDKVVDFFPGQRPTQVSERLAALSIEHLLTMSVGHATDSTPIVTRDEDWVRSFLAVPIEFDPGSVYLYDSAATYMLSAIVQKVTGEKLVDYLRPRFFDPLGMPRMRWAECPRGINTGGWGLSATTDSLIKYGQFYLQNGRWNGRQLLPREWIEQATTFKIQQPARDGQNLEELKATSDWHQGYGYLFLRCRHDAFRSDGSFGQYCIMLPKLDAVVAITGNTLDLQGMLNLVWDHLLPGLEQPGSFDRDAQEMLRTRLARLSLKPPDGNLDSSRDGTRFDYAIEANTLGVQRLSVAFDGGRCRVVFDIAGRKHAIDCGIGRWQDGETELPGTPPEFTELTGRTMNPRGPTKVAAAGAWKDADTFQMQWRYYETPFSDAVTLKFSNDAVEVVFLNSFTQVAARAHPETRPALKGTKS
jgi:CubicO group peptidase (beta-lactamase class C family)